MPSENFRHKIFSAENNDQNFHTNYLELKLTLTKIKQITVVKTSSKSDTFVGEEMSKNFTKVHQLCIHPVHVLVRYRCEYNTAGNEIRTAVC